ncbi:MAG: hypothetical protein TEF_11910 [Rhizobiales bacterium NRL2]|nr:MAG: hypothetical protein TEF_11910 [Rhizobiales bacterium NRL2]
MSIVRSAPGRLFAMAIVFACALPLAAQEPEPTVFEAERLNAGLGAPPENFVRETPRGTLETFLDLADRRMFDAAAHALNLNGVEADRQRRRGAELARMLYEVIERRVVIDWQDVPTRPDGLDESLSTDHPFAGKQRRSIRLGSLMLDNRSVPIRLNRIGPADTEPVWVFSRKTVGMVPQLHAAFGPTWFERSLPASLRESVTASIRAWELIALPVLFLASLAAVMVLRAVVGRTSANSRIGWISRASDEARTPLAIGLVSVALLIGVDWALSFSSAVTLFLYPLLWALVIFSLTLAVVRTIDATLEVVTERYVGEIDGTDDSARRHLYTNVYGLRRFVLLVAFVLGSVLLLHKLQLFESFGMSLLASAGVATVILGIAGQSILGNILASLQVAIAKPIRIGDSVLYEDRWSHVESIFYTYIVLKTWDERRLIVPVKYFLSRPFENWTMIDSTTVRSFAIELDQAARPADLRDVFEKLVARDDDAMEDGLLLVAVEGQTEHAQTVNFYATASNPTDAWMMEVRLAERMGDWIRENHPEWWPRVRLERPGRAGRLEPRVIDANGAE